MYKDFKKGSGYKKDHKPPEKFVHPKNFISNMDKVDEEMIMKAAKMTSCSVYVDDRGFNHHGQPLKDTISLYSAVEGQDLSQMWIIFGELKRGTI